MTELPIPAVLAVDVEPFTDEQLDAALSKSFLAAKGVLSEGHPSKFTVDNETVGEWAARKWAIENAEMERIRMQADEWRERITMWETAESLQAHGRRAFFEDRLTAFMARRRMESEYVKKDGTVDYRCKSVSLPSAVLKS